MLLNLTRISSKIETHDRCRVYVATCTVHDHGSSWASEQNRFAERINWILLKLKVLWTFLEYAKSNPLHWKKIRRTKISEIIINWFFFNKNQWNHNQLIFFLKNASQIKQTSKEITLTETWHNSQGKNIKKIFWWDYKNSSSTKKKEEINCYYSAC